MGELVAAALCSTIVVMRLRELSGANLQHILTQVEAECNLVIMDAQPILGFPDLDC